MGEQLFERLLTGVRLTPLGGLANKRARHVLREIEAAEETLASVVSSRAGCFRATATPMWMEAVLTPAAAVFHERLPGVEMALRTAPFAEGLWLLANTARAISTAAESTPPCRYPPFCVVISDYY